MHHWFAGDGMIHAFHIEDGRCAYLNRWVRTKKWELEHVAGESLFAPFDPMQTDPSVAGVDSTLANTNIVWHGDRLLALERGMPPLNLIRSLWSPAANGPSTMRSSGRMTAHPKLDPETGEMLFFGYMAGGPFTPDVRYHVVGKDGTLTRSDHFEAPLASMVHDFVTTRDHVLFPIFPLTGSLERAMVGAPPCHGSGQGHAHRRHGPKRRLQYAAVVRARPLLRLPSHECMDRGREGLRGRHEVRAGAAVRTPDGSPGDPDKTEANLVRWEFDLAANTDRVKETQLDDWNGEFPRLDERHAGLSYRHGYFGCAEPGARLKSLNAIGHIDHATGKVTRRSFGRDDGVSEPIFVPRAPDAADGDGFVLALVYRAAENRRPARSRRPGDRRGAARAHRDSDAGSLRLSRKLAAGSLRQRRPIARRDGSGAAPVAVRPPLGELRFMFEAAHPSPLRGLS